MIARKETLKLAFGSPAKELRQNLFEYSVQCVDLVLRFYIETRNIVYTSSQIMFLLMFLLCFVCYFVFVCIPPKSLPVEEPALRWKDLTRDSIFEQLCGRR